MLLGNPVRCSTCSGAWGLCQDTSTQHSPHYKTIYYISFACVHVWACLCAEEVLLLLDIPSQCMSKDVLKGSQISAEAAATLVSAHLAGTLPTSPLRE